MFADVETKMKQQFYFELFYLDIDEHFNETDTLKI